MEDLFASLKDVIVPDDCWELVEDGWKGDWCYFQKGHTPWNKGKKGTCPQYQKEIQRKMAIERNKQYKGKNNPRAKTWKIKKGYNKLGLRKLQLKKWKRYRDLVALEEVAQETLNDALDAL